MLFLLCHNIKRDHYIIGWGWVQSKNPAGLGHGALGSGIGWGEIIQGGMEMTDHCGPGRRKTQAGRRSDPEEMLAKVQAAAEEMTMRRYVHMPPEGRPCCPEGCLAALLGELNQIQDHQNQILAELLRALERMADALERR